MDVRGTELNPDQLENLRLAGAEENSVGGGFSVLDASQSGSALTVRVAEFADPADPYLWFLRQPTTFLLEALKDGLASLGEAPLGNLLAQGSPGGVLSGRQPPAGLFPQQEDAYRACLGSGLWLVWGPPGTGKTMVLKKAIGDLIAAGRRVLLVSATNIAVDNALLGVIKEGSHQRGTVVRVGPPQLRAVAENEDVSLPLLVRDRLRETENKRRELSEQLVAARARADRLNWLEDSLRDFDAAAHAEDRRFLATPGQDVQTCEATAGRYAALVETASGAIAAERAGLEQARHVYSLTERDRRLWARVDELKAEAEQVDQVATRAEAEALLARQETERAWRGVSAFEEQSGLTRMRNRRARAAAREDLEKARELQAELEKRAEQGRAVADRHRGHLAEQARTIAEATTHGSSETRLAERRVTDSTARLRRLTREHDEGKLALSRAEELTERARQAYERVTEAERLGHPARQDEADRLRPRVAEDAGRAASIEARYRQVQEEYEKLARDAQGEIIDGAFLVATTLARFRTNKRVFSGSYDVVLVDEVGAATLPEVLLAVARAKTASVMFGDFMQLGPVIPKGLRGNGRPDVKRWLLPDVFQHCGVDDPGDALRHPGCISLVAQSRFGPAVMDLANALAYDGALVASPFVRPRDESDPEIVLIDTDDLHELALPHRTGAARGWWPAGVLLSRALVDLHAAGGEESGIVTPYRDQAEATLEALRDIEGSGSPLAEVGTAHRFQGREFPIVIFDTVEGEQGPNLWMAQASRTSTASDWERTGLRLFNVAVTRVQTRLYVIASRRRIADARKGTAFTHLRELLATGRVRRVPAAALVTPPSTAEAERYLGVFGTELKEVLARHVEVSDVHDEQSFFSAFSTAIRHARHSLWIWTPWVARRVIGLLPDLRDAARRGVRITVFVRDPSDHLQSRHIDLINQLRTVAHAVVPMNVMHQKIVVIDERTVMIGSLNTMSQSRTREVMLTIQGGHFARRILEHEHATVFSAPPSCPRCGAGDIEIRRGKTSWYWRCYNNTCPSGSGRKAWRQDIVLTPGTTRHGTGNGQPPNTRPRQRTRS
ncbi:AAA domain-containing protein [Streptomyces anulatus]|uniref:AAA domain-containing protein n=1 Tax=Streptomyces anulatus TaxID=1892 RepID=UPI003431F23D